MRDDVLKDATVAYRPEAEYQSPYAELADELYRQEVLQARQMSPEDKLILGERLFRWACEVTLAGIRFQNPGANEEACQQILRERIALGERLEAIQ